jgi:hypothetical protein
MGGAHYSGFGDTLLTISRIGECPVWSRQFGKSTDSNVPLADRQIERSYDRTWSIGGAHFDEMVTT